MCSHTYLLQIGELSQGFIISCAIYFTIAKTFSFNSPVIRSYLYFFKDHFLVIFFVVKIQLNSSILFILIINCFLGGTIFNDPQLVLNKNLVYLWARAVCDILLLCCKEFNWFLNTSVVQPWNLSSCLKIYFYSQL